MADLGQGPDAGTIAELVELGRRVGRDLALAQGGGGNASVKAADGATMAIKASGVRLAEMAAERGWLAVPLAAARADLADPALAAMAASDAHEAAMARLVPAGGGRPSMETHFHAALARAVLHLHPIFANVFACAEDGEARLRAALGPAAAWVPYVTPGFQLGRAVAAAAAGHEATHGRPPAVLVLESHGAIAQGATADEAWAAMAALLAAGEAAFGPLPAGWAEQAAPTPAAGAEAAALATSLAARGIAARVRPTRFTWLATLAGGEGAWPAPGPLVPDDVVFGAEPPAAAADALVPPAAWRAPGGGLILAGPDDAFLDAMEEMFLAQALVATLVGRHGRVRALPPGEANALREMPAERHRRAVAAASREVPPPCR